MVVICKSPLLMALMCPLQVLYQNLSSYIQQTNIKVLEHKEETSTYRYSLTVATRKGKDTAVSATTAKKEKNLVEPRELSGGGLLPADSTEFYLPWNWYILVIPKHYLLCIQGGTPSQDQRRNFIAQTRVSSFYLHHARLC